MTEPAPETMVRSMTGRVLVWGLRVEEAGGHGSFLDWVTWRSRIKRGWRVGCEELRLTGHWLEFVLVVDITSSEG